MTTISFIGSGLISSQLARLSVAAGYNVILSNSRTPDTLSELVQELGPKARAATSIEAARDGDLVVVSIPSCAYTKLPVEALSGKIVIDTMNYYPERDGDMPEVRTDVVTTSELVQNHLVGAKVVRALNNMDWVRLFTRARPEGASDRSALPIAGDDAGAKAAVAAYIEAIGYDAVDFGGLSDSWRSAPGTPVYVMPYVGQIPSEADTMSKSEKREWFLQNSGAPVTASDVRAAVEKAERSDRMFGDVINLPGAAI
jgi:8-hydroxy-5-deazaflavin:NADPH oxidoreductase